MDKLWRIPSKCKADEAEISENGELKKVKLSDPLPSQIQEQDFLNLTAIQWRVI